MSQALYHSTLVEHAQAGRSRGRLAAPQLSATVDNPLCGDRVTIDLALADGRIAAVGHQVRGCLLCEAAAEIIADHAPGKTAAELAMAGGVPRHPRTTGRRWPSSHRCMRSRAAATACSCPSRRWRRRWDKPATAAVRG